MAFVSPDVALRGEWQNAETIFQNQAAATLARFLGLDYLKQTPGAGKPVKRLFAKWVLADLLMWVERIFNWGFTH